MVIFILAIFGLCLGSFVNALVWRLYKQERANKEQKSKYSITQGRSMCVHCGHELSSKDLIPILSWLVLRGKCRYCDKPISWQYPLIELATTVLFIISYIFWPVELNTALETVNFLTWLVCVVGFVALVIYDLRYMVLPNKIIFPLIGVALANTILQFISKGQFSIISSAFCGALVGGGLFYLLFQISNGKWIGGGDVKLGFLLGILLGGPLEALLMLFLASLIGSLVSLPLLMSGKVSRKARIPFGPFLITGAIITQLWGERVVDWYLNTLL